MYMKPMKFIDTETEEVMACDQEFYAYCVLRLGAGPALRMVSNGGWEDTIIGSETSLRARLSVCLLVGRLVGRSVIILCLTSHAPFGALVGYKD